MGDMTGIWTPTPPWILVGSPKDANGLDDPEVFPAQRIKVCYLDGRRLATAPALFTEVSQALQFPEYFGRNWDALEECLGDLYNWVRREAILIVVSHAESVLPRGDAFRRFIKVISRAAEWIADPIEDEGVLNRPGVAVHWLFLTASASPRAFEQRIAQAGASSTLL